MADVKFVMDGARVAEILRSPTGMVAKFLFVRGEVVRQAAKSKAPRRTGCLQGSIVKRLEEDATTGFAVRVMTNTAPCSPERRAYGLYVEEDTKPHVIEGSPVLVFQKGGETIFARRVNHPGTKGAHMLKDALPYALA